MCLPVKYSNSFLKYDLGAKNFKLKIVTLSLNLRKLFHGRI